MTDSIVVISVVIIAIILFWNTIVSILKGVVAITVIVFLGTIILDTEETTTQTSTPTAKKEINKKRNENKDIINVSNNLLERSRSLEENSIRVDVYHHFPKSKDSEKPNIFEVDDSITQRIVRSEKEEISTQSEYCDNVVIEGNKHVLIEGYYSSEEEAMARKKVLTQNRIKGVRIIWLPCYTSQSSKERFAIVLGRPCNSMKSILEIKSDYDFYLYSAELVTHPSEIIVITGKSRNISPQQKDIFMV